MPRQGVAANSLSTCSVYEPDGTILDEQEQSQLLRQLSLTAAQQDFRIRLGLLVFVAISALAYVFVIDISSSTCLGPFPAQAIRIFSFLVCFTVLWSELSALNPHPFPYQPQSRPQGTCHLFSSILNCTLEPFRPIARWTAAHSRLGLWVSATCFVVSAIGAPVEIGSLAWTMEWYPVLVIGIIAFLKYTMSEAASSIAHLQKLQYNLKGA